MKKIISQPKLRETRTNAVSHIDPHEHLLDISHAVPSTSGKTSNDDDDGSAHQVI